MAGKGNTTQNDNSQIPHDATFASGRNLNADLPSRGAVFI
jgi:hypothetical protein